MNDSAVPADKMTDLSPETRAFLSKLEPEDIVAMNEGLKLARATMTFGRFFRWAIIGVGGVLVALWGAVEASKSLIHWLRGG